MCGHFVLCAHSIDNSTEMHSTKEIYKFHIVIVQVHAQMGQCLKVEKVGFDSNNARIQGELYISDIKPAPALVICHGFDGRGFRGHEIFRQLATKTCENGFVSLVFDFRGCGESGGQFDYGWGEQQDLKTAIDYLASRPEVIADSIFVLGHSFGGTIALYACQGDKRVKAITLWATARDQAYNVKKFSSLERGRAGYYTFTLLSHIDTVVNISRLFRFQAFGIPLRLRDVRRKLMKLNESEAVARFNNTPKLMLVGSSDRVVTVEETKMIYSAAKEPKELVIIESGNHVFQGKEDEAIEKTITWLRQQINRK